MTLLEFKLLLNTTPSYKHPSLLVKHKAIIIDSLATYNQKELATILGINIGKFSIILSILKEI